LVFIYKAFGNPFDNYWINTYWFMVSINSILVFIGIRKACLQINLLHEETIKEYRDILLPVIAYWGVMAIIRVYLFFNIERHSEVINSAGKVTTGLVCIVIMFIYLTAKRWFKK